MLGTHKLQLDASDDGPHAEDEGSEADEDDRRVKQQQQVVDFISWETAAAHLRSLFASLDHQD